MACQENTPCNCEDNPCGCATSTDEVVYQGPTLECTGIENCDTLTTVITKINALVCSDDFISTVITNIINNPTLLEQFTEIVNSSIECETVWKCIEGTTTTTTTTLACIIWRWSADGPNDSTLVYINCEGEEITIPVEDVTDSAGDICVRADNTPAWGAPPDKGSHVIGTEGVACFITTTTTTTVAPTTTTTTTL